MSQQFLPLWVRKGTLQQVAQSRKDRRGGDQASPSCDLEFSVFLGVFRSEWGRVMFFLDYEGEMMSQQKQKALLRGP